MILYDNHEHIRSLLQVEGSVVYRTIPSGIIMAIIAEAIALWLQWSEREDIWRPIVEDPWAANSVSFAITFAIVFRTSIAWNRYWEAARETQFMYSKWADCFAQLIASINSTDSKFAADAETAADPEQLIQKREAMAHLRLSLAHYFSILSAMASHRLTHGDIAVVTRHATKFGSRSTLMCRCCRLRKEWDNLVVSRQELRFRDREEAMKIPNLHVYALQDLGAEIRSKSKKKTQRGIQIRKATTMFRNDLTQGGEFTRDMFTDVATAGAEHTRDILTAGTAATTATVGAAKVGAAKVGAGLSAGAAVGASSASAVITVLKKGKSGVLGPNTSSAVSGGDFPQTTDSVVDLRKKNDLRDASCVSFGEEEIEEVEKYDSEEDESSEQSDGDRADNLDMPPPALGPKSMSIRSSVSNATWNADLGILNAMTSEELEALQPDPDETASPPDRVNMVSEWIREDINNLVSIVTIPPPIMSRCYQLLSSGVLGFNQSMKIADIPFPLPFSQLLEYLLLMFSFVLPVYTAIFTGGLLLTPVLAFCVTVSLWSLSEISRELENPFEDGPNQLPIVDAHERFVELVRSVYHTRKPRKAKMRTESVKSVRSNKSTKSRRSERGAHPDDVAVICGRAAAADTALVPAEPARCGFGRAVSADTGLVPADTTLVPADPASAVPADPARCGLGRAGQGQQ